MSSDKFSGNTNEAYNSYGETSTNIPVAGDDFKKNESPPDYWGASKKKFFNLFKNFPDHVILHKFYGKEA